ncbi:MAG: sigma-70 family RNA polymerase sigma factor [Candidatus Omnitrophica bacterium]|nr:sigma-70 family RNA polymerase sigma factor [Candidatus Omnitrophota bacterium]
MDQSAEDIALMSRVRDGDEKAFEKLVDLHKTRVFHLAYRFLGNSTEAQDAAQEIFVKVYQARLTYEPTAKFTTWLYTIAKNTCLKTLARTHPTVSLDEEVGSGDDKTKRQVADVNMPTPSEHMQQQEAADIVKAAIDDLPEQQRMAVILSRSDELSYDEIATVMGCSAKAVKSLLHRARVELKERLKKYFIK